MATFALVAVIGASPVAAEPAPGPAPLPEPAVPTFVNGLSQAVFPTGSVNWVNHDLWVETEVDSDFDGKLDRIHADVSRVRETDTDGLKVPVIMEASPYYAGNSNVVNWAVDHEIGFPPATRPVRVPSMINTSPQISTSFESVWVPRGYAVMHVEGLGSGDSEGCPTSGGRNETLGPKAVIDWLNGRARGFTTVDGTTEVSAYWTTGKTGMIGTSYNGTLPEGVATTGVEGLEAIVPISAISNWYDYYRANGAVRAPGGFQGEDLDVLEEYVYSRNNQTICRPVIADTVVRQDRVTGDSSPFWEERNYMNDVDNVHAATLVAHGTNDTNVMTKNAAQFYNALKANGVPRQFYFHQGGHGGSPPDVMLNRWFTRYLFGVANGVEALPKSWVVREADQCPPRTATVVGDQSNVSLLTVANSGQLDIGFTLTVPQTNASGTITSTTRLITNVPDSTHVQLATPVATAAGQRVVDGAIVSLVCGTANPTPYAEWPDPAMAPAELNFTAGAPAIGGLTFQAVPSAQETLIDNATITSTTLANAATSPNRLAFKTPVLTAPIRISGTPTVSLKMSFSKAKANLSAWLVNYPATGNGAFFTRGWIDPENRNDPAVTEAIEPGTMYRLEFDFQAKDSVIAAGRRLGVVILSSDRDHSIRPAPGTELTMDLDESTLTLPVVGGAAALAAATGFVAPTVNYTLAPPDPNGENGWYSSGDIALAWQVTDGGAALTKDGCVDETFSTDGTFTRSCTATNAAGSAGPVSVTVKRDTTAPAASAAVSGTPGLGGYRPANPTVTLTGTDATSGIARLESSLDGGPYTTYTAPFVVTGDGPHTVDYRAVDNAGHVSPTGSTSFLVDANAPTTTATLNPPAVGGIYRTPRVTLTADDGLGIGVAAIQYTVDGSGTRSYTTPFWVTGDGTHTVTFRAVDMLGKIETTKTITFIVDGSPPMSKATLSPAPVNGYYQHPTVTLSANDFESTGGSGIASIEYLLDFGSWTTYTGPFPVTGDGSHTIQFHATDNAGNVEQVKTKSFQIDATGPVITIAAPAVGASYLLNASATSSFSCTDAGSGVASCTGPSSIDTGTVGTRSFVVTATDLAGNSSTLTRTYSVRWPFSSFSVPSEAKAGSSVKVKFSLGGNRGTSIVASQGSATVSCTSPVTPATYPLAPGESYSSPSYSSGTYTITWRTVSSWKNTCRMYVLVLADGTTHTAVVRFK